VKDRVDSSSGVAHRACIRDVALHDGNRVADLLEVLAPHDLVEDDHLARSALEQPIDDVRADEAAPTCHEESFSA